MSLLLYYITDRTAFPGDEPTRRRRLLDKIAEAASEGVNYIQTPRKRSLHDETWSRWPAKRCK